MMAYIPILVLTHKDSAEPTENEKLYRQLG